MNFEIVEEPIRFNLKGISSIVENERYGEVGRASDEMRCGKRSRGPGFRTLVFSTRPGSISLNRRLKVSKAVFKNIQLTRHHVCPQWNYTIRPHSENTE